MSTRETKAYFPFVTQKCQHKDEINFRFGNILGTDSMTSSRDYHNLQEVEGGIYVWNQLIFGVRFPHVLAYRYIWYEQSIASVTHSY